MSLKLPIMRTDKNHSANLPAGLADPGQTLPVRMNPFFFHTAAQPLFGLYGPPSNKKERGAAVLLCSPLGHEYIRTHWCLRLLAEELMRAGFHVLRFDFSCQGDSWGIFEEATVLQWTKDISTAVNELQETSGVSRLSVVGMRLGGTLVCNAAPDVDQIILWDPIVKGNAYVQTLRQMQNDYRQIYAEASPCTPGAPFEDLLGYRYSHALILELEALFLDQLAKTKARRVDFVISEIPSSLLLEKANIFQVEESATWEVCSAFTEPILLPSARRKIMDILTRETP
jgi:alpha/beta superfamily hydrolase